MKDKKIYANHWSFILNKFSKTNCDWCHKKVPANYPAFYTKRNRLIGADKSKQVGVVIHLDCATDSILKTTRKGQNYVVMNAYFKLLKASLTNRSLKKNALMMDEIKYLTGLNSTDTFVRVKMNEINCLKRDMLNKNEICPRCDTKKNVKNIDAACLKQQCSKCKIVITIHGNTKSYALKLKGYTINKYIYVVNGAIYVEIFKNKTKTERYSKLIKSFDFDSDVFSFNLTNTQILKKINTYTLMA